MSILSCQLKSGSFSYIFARISYHIMQEKESKNMLKNVDWKATLHNMCDELFIGTFIVGAIRLTKRCLTRLGD